jgi:hypothetical protein
MQAMFAALQARVLVLLGLCTRVWFEFASVSILRLHSIIMPLSHV